MVELSRKVQKITSFRNCEVSDEARSFTISFKSSVLGLIPNSMGFMSNVFYENLQNYEKRLLALSCLSIRIE